ncbi:ImmA/IrrE family metallo-endopeptidase [Brachybacterium hainanense]|uniref:ImmA/IrrE family metallo-endopeptidase n=1 Tax=Brachybacterium hainanense TaxID=1541174 RepID=A0ABV6RAV2_9MICO
MHIFHPWRELGRRMPHITVKFTDELTPPLLGETDGHSEIKIRKRLLQIDRRCTILHEMIHIEHGHDGHVEGSAERAVEVETATLLLPLDFLVWGLRWTLDPEELAEELWVRRDVLDTRLESLTDIEVHAVREAVSDAHGREATRLVTIRSPEHDAPGCG